MDAVTWRTNCHITDVLIYDDPYYFRNETSPSENSRICQLTGSLSMYNDGSIGNIWGVKSFSLNVCTHSTVFKRSNAVPWLNNLRLR